MSYETADILDSAADKIERDGWHQGDFAPPASNGDTGDGLATCALGAIAFASGGLTWRPVGFWGIQESVEFDSAGFALEQRTGHSFIPTWNDTPGRTQQEVLDALRGAAKAERRAADEVSA